jgi:hypothetical protein
VSVAHLGFAFLGQNSFNDLMLSPQEHPPKPAAWKVRNKPSLISPREQVPTVKSSYPPGHSLHGYGPLGSQWATVKGPGSSRAASSAPSICCTCLCPGFAFQLLCVCPGPSPSPVALPCPLALRLEPGSMHNLDLSINGWCSQMLFCWISVLPLGF